MKKLLLSFLVLISSFAGRATDIHLADPTIYSENGVYYLTGTLMGNGFRMYQSTDLVHWSLCGNASEGLALHKDDVFGDKWFWAPQIFKNIVELEETAIDDIAERHEAYSTLYNIAGQKVDEEYKGIVINGGKKSLRRY